MTFDQAMTKAAADLDRHFESLNDRSWTRMIEAGMSEDDALDLIGFIREANLIVRESAVEEIRERLSRECSPATRLGK